VRAKFDAVNRRDLAAIVAAYAPDAHLMASDFCAPRNGRDAVERTYTAAPRNRRLERQRRRSDRRQQPRPDANSRTRRLQRTALRDTIANYFEVRAGLIAYDLGVFNNGTRPCQ
jgi:hypothetical protein